jgi:protease II
MSHAGAVPHTRAVLFWRRGLAALRGGDSLSLADPALARWQGAFEAALSRDPGGVARQPERHGPFEYTLQSHPTNGRPVMYRSRPAGGGGGGRRVVEYFLDLSTHPLPGETAPLRQVQVRALRPSPDEGQRWIAATIDRDGSERCQLVIVVAANPPRRADGAPRPPRFVRGEVMEGVANVVWAPVCPQSPQRLYYTVLDAALRAHEVRMHAMGTDPAADVVVWRDGAADRYVDVTTSKDGRAVLLHVNSRVAGRVALLEVAACAGLPDGFAVVRDGRVVAQPAWLTPREASAPGRATPDGASAARSYATVAEGRVFMVTTASAAGAEGDGFAVLTAPVAEVARASDGGHWSPFLRPSRDLLLDDVDVFRDGLIVYSKRVSDGGPHVSYLPYRRPDGTLAEHNMPPNEVGSWVLPLPHDAVDVEGGANADVDAPAFECTVRTTTAPPQALAAPFRLPAGVQAPACVPLAAPARHLPGGSRGQGV